MDFGAVDIETDEFPDPEAIGMAFRVERDVLAEAITWTARTLPTRPAAPILAGVRIEARADDVVELSSFDYEVSGRCEFVAEVTTPGVVLVSGRLLAEIARSLPSRPVEVTQRGTKVHLACGAANFTLLSMPADEYPLLPKAPDTSGVLEGEAFAKAVSQASVAASRDDTVPLLTGVRLEIDGERISLLATDRYRLTLRELHWQPATPGFEATALVKAKTLIDVAKTLSAGEHLQMGLATGGGNELIGFQAGGRQTTSQLVDGAYPPVRQLFPESKPIHAVVPSDALIEAVRRVALVADRGAPIRLTFTQGQLQLSAGHGDDAQASDALEATLSGEDISVAFNPQYLLDGLTALDAPFTRFSFTHPGKPVEFTGQVSLEGEDDQTFRYLLVPIRFAS